MARNRNTSTKAAPAASKGMDPSVWEGLLSNLGSGGGEFFFPRTGRTRLRLVVPDQDILPHFYREVYNSYGKPKYLVLGIIYSSPSDDGEDSGDPDVVRPIILPKTCLKDIIGLAAAGYDLFSEDGHGITITRSGTGMRNTSYSVIASVKPQSVDLENLEWPEGDLDEIAERFMESASERAQTRASEDGEESEVALDKPASSLKRRKVTPAPEPEDEEEEEVQLPRSRSRSRPRY